MGDSESEVTVTLVTQHARKRGKLRFYWVTVWVTDRHPARRP